jgi:two-component system CheB/CheR fusion protein
MAARKKPSRGKKPSAARTPVKPKEQKPPAPAERPTPQEETRPSAEFPVVGIVASAGGLEAFKKFFAQLPADSGMAFVLVPHLDPNHQSLMAELLGRHTPMPVVEAKDGQRVERNRVYIIPPNRDMALRNGQLRLTEPTEPRMVRTGIDFFLRSLAEARRERAIGIVLSGTGTHGTLGLKLIKAEGGLAIVQDPETAEYDQMPRSAINTGVADFVLAPEEMARALLDYARHFYVNGNGEQPTVEEAPDYLYQILALLSVRLKLDFRTYRKRMLARRVERRMSLKHFEELPAYLAYLRENSDELRLLSKDLLISVTSFFRDAEMFQLLAAQVIPELIQRKDSGSVVRVWIPGCATGEEAYSITMMILEQIAAAQKNLTLQVFATDIDEEALNVARHGLYPETVAADISPERLTRFFSRADDHNYEVSRQLRESLVFAPQNLVTDPPFSKLDLISCRNVLIYLEPDTQRRLLPLLHFALVEGGYLVLGSSETVGRAVDLFEPISKKWRVYRAIGRARPEQIEFPAPPGRESRQPIKPPESEPRINFAELASHSLLEELGSAAVIVNRRFEILYFHGATGRFLEMPSGEPTQDLLRLAREGLRTKLRSAVHQVVREYSRVVIPRVRTRFGGTTFWAKAIVRPLQIARGPEGLVLVILEDESHSRGEAATALETHEETAARHMEEELAAARQDLQITIEELESSNEELKSSNEEVMSMNEELQSANEELESSKEELQSLNEEMSTVNNQLQDKVQELEGINNDLANLLASTDIATIFLDTAFNIKRFTPATTRLLSLLATDVGRPINTFAQRFHDNDLLNDAKQVLDNLRPSEKEIGTNENRVCLRRIMPYRTIDNRIEGVVVTFTDVTQMKKAAERQRLLATVLLTTNDATMVYDFAGRISVWNHSAERMYGYTEAEALALEVQHLIPSMLRADAGGLLERLRRGENVEQWETQRLCKDGQVLDVWVTPTILRDDVGRPVAVASVERDMTERKRAEKLSREFQASLEQKVAARTADMEAANRKLQDEITERQHAEESLRVSEERFRLLVEGVHDYAIFMLDQHGGIVSWNTGSERITGYRTDEIIGRHYSCLFPPDAIEEGRPERLLTTAADQGHAQDQYWRMRKDGSRYWAETLLTALRDEDGQVKGFSKITRDLTEQKRADEAVREMEREMLEATRAEQQRIGQDLHDSVGQELTGLGLMAESLVQAKEGTPKPEFQTIQKIADGLRRALKQVRAVCRGLMPVEVDAEGLMSALGDLATRTREVSGISCTFDCDEPVLVDDTATATHLYHIAQEAVTNAIKHAKASEIGIALAGEDHHLMLSVRDDGIGLNEPSSAAAGMGLKIMQYRAGLINATLTVRPADGRGTLVTCVLYRGGTHAEQQEERREDRPGPDRR